jgi:hypothetical protein
MPTPCVVTLVTDFGLRDHFVAAMKGVMLGINPNLLFVDISNLIPPHDIFSGAFTLGQAYSYFSPGTIHMAIVDPGVGTARKALAVYSQAQFFVAPDNGVLTYVLNDDPGATAYEITADHYFRKPVSSTFHGRDVFAPVVAWISRGDLPLHQLGPVVEKPVRLAIPAVARVRDNLMQGAILAVDHFGNLITNLKPADLPVYKSPPTGSCKILASKTEITTFKRTFAEGKAGELFVVPGSSGYLEIVTRNASAASMLNLAPGAAIGVMIV